MKSTLTSPIVGLALLALLALLAGTAAAQLPAAEFTISSGRRGGNYYRIAGRLRTQLTVDYGAYVEIVTSQGSVENLARLEDPLTKVNIALTQTDALGRYLDENPAFAEEFMVLADVGKECVFLVTSKKGGIETAADLRKEGGGALSVDSPNSGAAVTWEFMSHIEPAFRNTETAHVEVMEALLQLQTGPPLSKLAAVMLVQRPKTVSPPLEIILKSRDKFRIAPIRPQDLKSPTLPSGNPIYTHEEVTTRYAGNAFTFDTICTRGLLLAARAKLTDETRSKLIETMLKAKDYIAPAEE